MDQKKLKYQLKFFLRKTTHKDLVVSHNENGNITLRMKFILFDYSTIIYLCLGFGVLILNYQKNYSYILYLISGLLLLIVFFSIISGYYRNKNNFFYFSPESQTITYSNSICSKPKTIQTTQENIWWSEIDEYYNGGKRSYSATFYAQNKEKMNKKRIVFQMNSDYKSDCIKFGRALNQYIEEMSDLKGIRLVEKY